MSDNPNEKAAEKPVGKAIEQPGEKKGSKKGPQNAGGPSNAPKNDPKNGPRNGPKSGPKNGPKNGDKSEAGSSKGSRKPQNAGGPPDNHRDAAQKAALPPHQRAAQKAPEMPEPKQEVTGVTKEMARMGLSTANSVPEAWKVSKNRNAATSIRNFISSLPDHQSLKGFSTSSRSIGLPNGERKVLPFRVAALQSNMFEHLVDELDHVFITMYREGESMKQEMPPFPVSTSLQWNGIEWEEIQYIKVDEDEVASFESKGWKIYFPPKPAYKWEDEEWRDARDRPPKPVDIFTTDKPAADAKRYLKQGIEHCERFRVNEGWKAGDLLGKDGSDEQTKLNTASYAPPQNWNKITDRRSATSNGHIWHRDRPNGICVGWGGFDKFNHWQSCGRQITDEMVKEEGKVDWEKEADKPMRIVDEHGNLDMVVDGRVPQQFLPDSRKAPRTLYEIVSKVHRPLKLKPRELTKPAWAGSDVR